MKTLNEKMKIFLDTLELDNYKVDANSIENYFEKSSSNNGDGEEGNEEYNQENNYGSVYKKKKTSSNNESCTIMDLLQSAKHEREEKINIINELCKTLFPEVEGDKVTFIGSTFMKFGEKKTIFKSLYCSRYLY